jgi:hypothetical protein
MEGRLMRHQHQTETDLGDALTIEIRDRLEMLVTSDPVAELDHALGYAAACLRGAKASGNAERAQCILAWIDRRLDERLAFQHETGGADQWLDV